MKPYYEEPGITIYHGDCRDILPTLPKVDLVLTDPPYGIENARTNVRKIKSMKGNYQTDKFIDNPEFVASVVIPVIRKCGELADRVVVTPGRVNMFIYPKPLHVGLFFYPASCAPSAWGLSLWQPIYFYGRDPYPGRLLPDGKSCTDFDLGIAHPCPKPLKSWTWLLNRSSLPTDIVCDPFMGSGTTLRAAKDLGQKAIGIEIEEKYCEIAVKRLRQEVLPLEA
jgi:site-specific DNA-methyltransferase (adenine-specific)